MKLNFRLLLLLCITTVTVRAQQDQAPLLSLGDPAPPLRVRKWIKGTAVPNFEKGRIYVIEFWATWCKPCIAAMPHLSVLARGYRDTVTVVAVDIYENKNKNLDPAKNFVQDMGDRMDFHVAAEDTNFTVRNWIEASGTKDDGIPSTFVVNAQGKIAWIGHPKDLDTVLRKIVDNTWDIKKALSIRAFNKYLYELDTDIAYKVGKYTGDYYKLDDLGKPDSILSVINRMVKKEPRLKYAPVTAMYTFSALLRTNPHKAYEYGKEVIVTPTYTQPAYDFIIGDIKDDSRILTIPAEIYRLGAECYQAKIDNEPYPELINLPLLYHKMAAWYSLGYESLKAIEAEQQAIKIQTNASLKAN